MRVLTSETFSVTYEHGPRATYSRVCPQRFPQAVVITADVGSFGGLGSLSTRFLWPLWELARTLGPLGQTPLRWCLWRSLQAFRVHASHCASSLTLCPRGVRSAGGVAVSLSSSFSGHTCAQAPQAAGPRHSPAALSPRVPTLGPGWAPGLETSCLPVLAQGPLRSRN